MGTGGTGSWCEEVFSTGAGTQALACELGHSSQEELASRPRALWGIRMPTEQGLGHQHSHESWARAGTGDEKPSGRHVIRFRQRITGQAH